MAKLGLEDLVVSKGSQNAARIWSYSRGSVIAVSVPVPNTKTAGVVLKNIVPGDPEFSMELRGIARTLTDSGVNVYSLRKSPDDVDFYPGDAYVRSLSGAYVPSSDFGGLGQSGFVLLGRGFVLIGRKAVNSHFSNSSGLKFGSSRANLERFKALAKTLYGVEEAYLLPAAQTAHEGSFSHIDLFVGSVPEANILSVAATYYRRNKRRFDELKERFNPDIIVTEEQGGVIFENNYRVVYNGEGGVFVIIDKRAEDLTAKLRDRGLSVVPTSAGLRTINTCDASVHCVTNVFDSVDLLTIMNRLTFHDSLSVRPYNES